MGGQETGRRLGGHWGLTDAGLTGRGGYPGAELGRGEFQSTRLKGCHPAQLAVTPDKVDHL